MTCTVESALLRAKILRVLDSGERRLRESSIFDYAGAKEVHPDLLALGLEKMGGYSPSCQG